MARIRAVTDDDNPADRFALAIQLGNAATHLGPELDVRDLAKQNRNAIRADADRDLSQIVERLHVPAHAQDEFLLRHLDRATADLAVAFLDRHAHVGNREVVGAQLGRIDRHLVLLHEPADRRDLGHAFD